MSVQLESNQLAFATTAGESCDQSSHTLVCIACVCTFNRELWTLVTAGVYAMDLDRFGRVQPVTTMEQGQPLVLGLAWNSASAGQSYLYAANGPTISAYRAMRN